MNRPGHRLFASLLDHVVQPVYARKAVFCNNLGNRTSSKNKQTQTHIGLVYLTSYFWRLTKATSKLALLRMALSDPMLPTGHREQLITDFGCAQRLYSALATFAQRWRLRRAKIVVDQDMQLNPIAEGERHVLCIYHERHKYLFNVHELLRQINVYLGNSFMFHSEPLHIKNPYNNVPFPKSVLYHLYLFLMFNHQWGSLRRFESSLFAKFCRCEFDLQRFEWEQEPVLRERAIEAHLANSPLEALYQDVRSILSSFNQGCLHRRDRILVDADFPPDLLVSIFRPFLRLEYRRCFSLVPTIKSYCRRELRCRLEQFQRYNPNFGVMRYRLRYKRMLNDGHAKFRATTEKTFDTQHAPWYQFDRDTFLCSHRLSQASSVPEPDAVLDELFSDDSI